MNWRTAFLRQARSDYRLFKQTLNQPHVEYCHRLHYLQMATEKLAKAILQPPHDIDPPSHTHVRLVSALKAIRQQRELARYFGKDKRQFVQYVGSLLPMASEIETLAPAAAIGPNAEYPWQGPSGIEVPCEYAFAAFSPRSTRMTKFVQFLDRLFTFDWESD